MKICIILGTRPEIIKMSPIIRECEAKKFDYFVIHTNQHYSKNMDKVFFNELNLPNPKYNLNIGSGLHGEQTGKMMIEIEKILIKEKPGFVFVEGDTNTVLAGALTAAKLHIKLGHIEAGLRSGDKTMPEEVNRVMTDHLSDQLYVPTFKAKINAMNENIPKKKIFLTGNTISDAINQNISIAEKKSKIIKKLKLENNNYFLFTFHRTENVDNEEKLISTIKGLGELHEKYNKRIIFPMHLRTKKMVKKYDIRFSAGIEIIDPVGYLDMLMLIKNAKLVLTDSGGIQEESCILKTPCVTIRENTERPETLDIGSNILSGTNPKEIVDKSEFMLSKNYKWKNPYGDGMAGNKIIEFAIDTENKDIKSVLNLAINWLVESGIQNVGSKNGINGSFNSWYDVDKKDYEYIYSEVTGYGVTTFIQLYQKEKKQIYLDRAKLAADWLLKNADKNYVISIFKLENTSHISIFKDRMVHAFDNSIILKSLADTYTVTKDEKYLDGALRIADFLIEKMYLNHSFYPLYDVKTELVLSSPTKWSTIPGSYHAKNAMGFMLLYEITKDDKYKSVSVNLCKKMLSFQNANGRFKTTENGDTHLHPHCYSAEGLLYVGIKLGNKEFINSSLNATKWAINSQIENGGIPFYFEKGKFSSYERVDILAQTLRLAVYFFDNNYLDITYREKINKLAQRLCQFQYGEGSVREKGGINFGYDFDGKKLNHSTSWVTMFSIQALDWYLNGGNGEVV